MSEVRRALRDVIADLHGDVDSVPLGKMARLFRKKFAVMRGVPETARVLVIGDRPEEDDMKSGLPFSTEGEGAFVRRLYKEARQKEMGEDAIATNCVFLRPPGHRNPNARELHAYAKYVSHIAMSMQNLEVIVCLGPVAATLVTHGFDVHEMYLRPYSHRFSDQDVPPSRMFDLRQGEGQITTCVIRDFFNGHASDEARNVHMVPMCHPREMLWNNQSFHPTRHALTDRMKKWVKTLRFAFMTLDKRTENVAQGLEEDIKQPSARPYNLEDINLQHRLEEEPERFTNYAQLQAATSSSSEQHPFIRHRPDAPPSLDQDLYACIDEYVYCPDRNEIDMYLTTSDNYTVVVHLKSTRFHMWVDPHPCISAATGVHELLADNYCSRLRSEIISFIGEQLKKPHTAKNISCPSSHLHSPDVYVGCELEDGNRVNNEGFQSSGRTMIRIEVSHYLLLHDVYRTLLEMLKRYKDHATEHGTYVEQRMVICDHVFKPTEKLSFQYGIKASHWLRFPKEYIRYRSLDRREHACYTQIEADFDGPEFIECISAASETPLMPAYPPRNERERELTVTHSAMHPQTVITSLDTEWVGMEGGFPNYLCDPITTISMVNHHKHRNTRYLTYYGFIPEEGYQKVNFQLGPYDCSRVDDLVPDPPKSPSEEGFRSEKYYDKRFADNPEKLQERYEEQLRQWNAYKRFCESESTNFQFSDEGELLLCWALYMLRINPDTVCGHNVKNFDLRMILMRMSTLGVPIQTLGRDPNDRFRVDLRKFVSRAYGERIITEIRGMTGWCLADTLEIFLREKKLPSYTLNFIARKFVGDQKDEVPYAALPGLWKGSDQDRAKVVKYCRRDAQIPDQLMNVCAWGENMVEFARINGTKTRNDNYVVGQQIKVLSAAQHVNRERGLKIRFEHSRAAIARHNEEVVEKFLMSEGSDDHVGEVVEDDTRTVIDAMVIDEAEGITDIPPEELEARKRIEQERLEKMARQSRQVDLSSMFHIQLRIKALDKLLSDFASLRIEEEAKEKSFASSSSSLDDPVAVEDDQDPEEKEAKKWVAPEELRKRKKRKREPTEEEELSRQQWRKKVRDEIDLPRRERARQRREEAKLQKLRSRFIVQDKALVDRELIGKQIVLQNGSVYTLTEQDLSILTKPMSEIEEEHRRLVRERNRESGPLAVAESVAGDVKERERLSLLDEIRELEKRLHVNRENSLLSRLSAAYQGATVMPPVPGLHYRFPVICVDFASLYPSIMMRYNISPDTILFESDFQRLRLPDGRRMDTSMGHRAPGITGLNKRTGKIEQVYFIKKKYWHGILPLMEDILLQARKGAKRSMAFYDVSIEEPYGSDNWIPNPNYDSVLFTVFNGRQNQIKIVCNSGYGAMGANGMLANKLCAAAVTAWGRVAIELVRDILIDRYNAECVGGDTDSVFMIFPGFPKDHPKSGTPDDVRIESVQEAEAFSGQLEKFINAHFKMPMKIEYEKAMFPLLISGKKRYCGIIHEKGKKGHFFSKGMETVRRDSLPFTKDTMMTVFDTTLKVRERDETFEEYDREVKRRKVENIRVIQERCLKLLNGDVKTTDLIMSQQLSRAKYDIDTRGAHLTVRDKKIARGEDPPKLGERVAFLFVQLPTEFGKQTVRKGYELAEDPEYAILHDLPINYAHYLDKKFVKPVLRAMRIILREEAMTSIIRKHTVRTVTGQKRRTIAASDISENMIGEEVECMLFKRARKGTARYRNVQTRYMDRTTISQPSLRAEYSDMAKYVRRVDEMTLEQRIDALKRRTRLEDPHEAFDAEKKALAQKEQQYESCLDTCRACLRAEEVICANKDCPSYYPRIMSRSKFEQQKGVVQQLSVDIENLHLLPVVEKKSTEPAVSIVYESNSSKTKKSATASSSSSTRSIRSFFTSSK